MRESLNTTPVRYGPLPAEYAKSCVAYIALNCPYGPVEMPKPTSVKLGFNRLRRWDRFGSEESTNRFCSSCTMVGLGTSTPVRASNARFSAEPEGELNTYPAFCMRVAGSTVPSLWLTVWLASIHWLCCSAACVRAGLNASGCTGVVGIVPAGRPSLRLIPSSAA